MYIVSIDNPNILQHHLFKHQKNSNIIFRTSNKHVHILIIKLEDPIFGFERSNIVRPITNTHVFKCCYPIGPWEGKKIIYNHCMCTVCARLKGVFWAPFHEMGFILHLQQLPKPMLWSWDIWLKPVCVWKYVRNWVINT